MSNEKRINEVVMNGRLIRRLDRPDGKSYAIVMSKAGASAKDIFIRFFCGEGVLPEGLRERDHVDVRGHILSYEYNESRTGRHRFMQSFVADGVEKSKTLIEAEYGLEGGFYPPSPRCLIKLSGRVMNVLHEGYWTRILLSTASNDPRGSYVRLSLMEKARKSGVSKGDFIYTVCSVSTPVKEVNGRKEYFEDLFVSDMLLVPGPEHEKAAGAKAVTESGEPVGDSSDFLTVDDVDTDSFL